MPVFKSEPRKVRVVWPVLLADTNKIAWPFQQVQKQVEYCRHDSMNVYYSLGAKLVAYTPYHHEIARRKVRG